MQGMQQVDQIGLVRFSFSFPFLFAFLHAFAQFT